MVSEAQVSVGILLGSANDWLKVQGVAEVLDQFGVDYEVSVMSAHRTPADVAEYASRAADRGLQVLIAAAGGAAHLAGVLAAHSILPVIGIPVATEVAGGLDSLLSMVQMPGDVPVAVVGTNSGGPRNAGLLAVQILALSRPDLREKLLRFKHQLAEKVRSAHASLQAQLRQQKQTP